jgi:protein-disulfide isomerase
MENMDNQNMEKKKDWLMPASILIAAGMVSVALIYNVGQKSGEPTEDGQLTGPQPIGLTALREPGSKDHWRGPQDAKIVLVEYSDTECPFCQLFHNTLAQAAKEYPNDFAWVYRHYPIAQLHSKATKEAEATECAAELGGNDGFWQYMDRLMEVTPANNGLDTLELPKIAAFVGLDEAKFKDCLASGKYADKVNKEIAEAQEIGAQGTPYSVLIFDGQKYEIGGFIPFDENSEYYRPGAQTFKMMLDSLLNK